MTWNVISTFVLDQVYGYQTANKIRDNLVVLASRRTGRFLGGSRVVPNDVALSLFGPMRAASVSLGPIDAYSYIDVEIDGTNQSGITYQARVEVRTDQTAVSITPKIRNVTDSTDAGTGSACTATAQDYSGTNQKQTIALTIASGIKKYRLQYSVSGLPVQTWATGEIESFATA